ncbi:hypothetical protein Tsubulata_015430 [Turnera subulata]|uniref:R13L1/DRL21-like LRR repeat region domain-containing protein n=1 Tax=Turnera subulata TaxID=218843 RepID=A0A9Q0FFW5_9ROSI|nr:hypothetical protein Tsubulata_015430 [Turnera subulata]
MPPQFSQLTKLIVLTDFFVGKQENSSIAELGSWEHLRGELCIWNLENAVNVSHGIQANLKDKKYIQKLELRWNDGELNSLCEQILEHLRPSTSLKYLDIHGFQGERYPDWLADHCFSNLETFSLKGGRYCSKLPALGQLKFLKELEKEGFDRIVTLMPPMDDGEDRAFPLLRELRAEDCPELEPMLPHFLLPSLSVLETTNGQMQQLVASIPKARCMHLMRYGEYLTLYKLPTGLYDFRVKGLSSTLDTLLRVIEEVGFSDSNLEGFEINECDETVYFPIGRFQNLSHLVLLGLRALPSLSSLHIAWCKEVESFPEETLLPSSLTSLSLWDFPQLKSLDYNGLHHLSSLNALKLSGCRNLQSLPREGLPCSLKYLQIWRCHDTLKQRCKEEGEDWSKICHIPKIDIS